MLLEAYFMGLDQTTNRLQALNEYIEDTEDLVNLKLDQHRNELIGVDLVLTAMSLCVAMMTAVAGYFGMVGEGVVGRSESDRHAHARAAHSQTNKQTTTNASPPNKQQQHPKKPNRTSTPASRSRPTCSTSSPP